MTEEIHHHKRIDLSERQKRWILEAWRLLAVAKLGFADPTLPNAIPCYNEYRGHFHVPAIKPELHHIIGVSEYYHVYGVDDSRVYNNPENIAVVSALNHRGTGGATEEDFVIHDITRVDPGAWAAFKRGEAEDPYIKMREFAYHLLSNGLLIHNTQYDEYMSYLAHEAVKLYLYEYVDPYPTRKNAH